VGAPLVLVARPALAFVGQATAAILLWRAGSADPWREAAPWFQVFTSVMDLGCLALLFGAIYLWRGRLVPLIVAHIGIDLIGGVYQTLLPAVGAAAAS
jgi:hypothetical protein